MRLKNVPGLAIGTTAGFSPIRISGGNIIDSGTQSLCTHYEENFDAVLNRLR